MRYSELAGKEIIDISEGTRLGVASSTDLIIDSATGAVEAMVILQRTGIFTASEIAVPWEGIRKIGRHLIIVDLSMVEEAIGRTVPVARAKSKTRRHRVPGLDDEVPMSSPPEDEAPQLLLSRMAAGDTEDHTSFWPRGRRSRSL